LGETIVDIIKHVPDGVLLFFSSYAIMEESINRWNKSNIWSKLNEIKCAFKEKKKKEQFNEEIENYKRNVDGGRGSIFMGICRGCVFK
jgi:Rad3-related DNA helicase